MNIIQHLTDRYEKHPTALAIRYKDRGRWHSYRWQDVHQVVASVASGIESLGLQKGDRLAIMSETRPEWFLTDLAALAVGAVIVPIYPNLMADDVSYILEHSEAKILVLEDVDQFERWKTIKDKHPGMQVFIIDPGMVDPENIDPSLDWSTWSTLLEKGRRDQKDGKTYLRSLADKISLDDLATIPYTSGTTGRPKGVALTHNQIMSELEDVFKVIPVNEKDITLTFLPFSHIFGRVESWGSVVTGYTLGFAESIDRLKDNLGEVQPTFLIAVPRIFEKLYAAIQSQAANNPVKKRIFDLGLSVGKKYSTYIRENRRVPLPLVLEYTLFDQAVFKTIREKLGGRLRFAISGSAPLAREIAEFFHSIGVPIFEGYGLTETTAGITFNTPFEYKFGTVGKPLPDVELKFAADGEVLVKSRKVMRDYYKNPEATAAVMQDGYFKTGDIGELDAEGYLRLTDRKKDLIKTAGGKYVAPQKLENLLKLNPLISNVLIHGDQRNYVVALVTLNRAAVEDFAKQKDLTTSDYAKLVTTREIQNAIKSAVSDTNSQLASFESIKKFKIIANDFTVETGELTPSLKVKRKVVEDKYRQDLDGLYKGGM
jgi:long-chain acyl-CoA synthetase